MTTFLTKASLSVLTVFQICALFCVDFKMQDLDDVTISGRVSDSNGDIVIGAEVTAVMAATGSSRSVTTNSVGEFRLIKLRPGQYFIKASATGFETTETGTYDTISGQNLRLPLVIRPAGIKAEIPVDLSAAGAPVIDTARTIVGATLTQNEIDALPNTSNDVLDFVFTLSGVVEEPLSIRNLATDDRIGGGNERDQPAGVLGAGSFSLSGSAAYSTNITIDGLDNNDDRTAAERFQPPPGAVAEVQVVTNQFSAEYGRASGGRINIRTRAGGRNFRGSLSADFESHRLNANTYNNNRRGLSRLPFFEYEPSGTLGGSVPFWYFKNRTYFFSSYSLRDRDAATQIFTAVPVQKNPLLNLPSPTHPEFARRDLNEPGSAEIAPYIARVRTAQIRRRLTLRIDHNFNDVHNLTANFQRSRSKGFRQYRETTRFLEETLQGKTRNSESFYLTDNIVINSGFVNQIRFQYSIYRPDFGTQNPLDPVILLRIRDETLAGNEDRINGTVVIGNSTANFANSRSERRFQIQETANLARGSRNLRIGADIQSISSTTSELADTTGTINFEDVNGFLDNRAVRFRRNSGSVSTLVNTYAALFVQHDWQLRQNLSVNFGLRYERETLLEDKNNLGPRFALAYSPGKAGRSVFRFGAGVFYNRVLLRTVDDFTIDRNQRRFDSNRLDGPSDETRCFSDPAQAKRDECLILRFVSRRFPGAPTIPDLESVPGIADLGRGFSYDVLTRELDQGISIPESYQANLGYQLDIGRGFALEANLTYNKAVRLWREQNVNAIRLPAGFSSFTEYLISLGDVTISGTSSGTDIYRFILGDRADTNGDKNFHTGADCNSSTPLCVVNLNTLNGSTSTLEPIGIARRVLEEKLGRPVTNDFRQLERVGSIGKSIFTGISIELRRRNSDIGFGFRSSVRLSYVLSKTRDDGFVDTSSAQVQGDFRSELSRSLIDRRHKIRFSGTIQLPGLLGKLRISPLVRLESGRPFNISIGGSDRNLDDVGTDRPNFNGNPRDIVWRHPNDPFPANLLESFSLAPIGSPGGNLGRNAGIGPPLFILNMSLSRQFKFKKRIRIRPKIEFDNILNATVFSFGSDFINLATAGTPEFERGFLTPSRTLGQRRIQIGIKIDF